MRACRPPARVPTRSWSARRSTIGDVDTGQRQLAGQHQAGRATAGDHHGVVMRVVLRMAGAGPFGVAARPGRRKQYRHVMTPRVWMVFGSRVLRQGPGLEASPLHTTYLSGERESLVRVRRVDTSGKTPA